MLNAQGVRELAYVVAIDSIYPIEGRDRVECAVVGGWTIMVQKDRYKPGDLAVYFEIDSKVPETETFAFMEKYKHRVKTQKFKKFYSQGLLMSAEELGGERIDVDGEQRLRVLDKNGQCAIYNKGDFLTEALGVTYYEAEDNRRKAPSADKYKKMAARHPKIFRNPIVRWFYKRDWGKKLLFIFFGKQKDGRNWPAWVIKTDEERVENMPFILENKDPWIATEKIDGTSTTFTMLRRKELFGKNEFYVCSRNVVFDKPDKACYYDTQGFDKDGINFDDAPGNVYLEMAVKYNAEDVLTSLLEKFPDAKYITIQGETYGAGVQKRDYSQKGHDFAAFNLIIDGIRLNSGVMQEVLDKYGVPTVPILTEEFILPDTVDELREYVDSEASRIDGKMREGIVFRSQDGVRSFKCVSPNYLVKFHG